MADAIFDNPQLVAIYDAFENPRDDLGNYLAIAEEFNARTVIDLGCGTGAFARELASRGRTVVGIDPAAASLQTARAKAADESLEIDWICGTSTQIPTLDADLITMTGNVAQVFLGIDELTTVIGDCARGLRAGGHLVFETRDPDAQAWQDWAQIPARTLNVAGVGDVTETFRLGQVELPFVSFTHLYRFHETEETIGSRSRLRFHTRKEVTSALGTAGFEVREVRDAPDRPGRELVFIAVRV